MPSRKDNRWREASPDIRSLAALTSAADMLYQLSFLANVHGKTSSIACLPATAGDEGDGRGFFLVNFERPQDAAAASLAWNCQPFGFTSVIVAIPGAGAVLSESPASPGSGCSDGVPGSWSD